MIAAKAPPTPDIIADAQCALDIAMLWASGDRQLEVDGDGVHVGRDELVRISNAAIAEYLRQNPRARCKGSPWLQVTESMRENGKLTIEIHFVCLFCRESINTLAATVRTPPMVFWEKLEKHCYPCACQFLVSGEGLAPNRNKGERIVPLAKLKGKKLRKAANEAATYLFSPYVPRRRRPELRGAYWDRRIVADARAVARLRAKDIPDAENPKLAAARAFWGSA